MKKPLSPKKQKQRQHEKPWRQKKQKTTKNDINKRIQISKKTKANQIIRKKNKF